MQMRKDKKPWNIWEWVKTPVGIFGNSQKFSIIPKILIVNLGTLAYFRNNDKCLKVMNSLKILINISLIPDNNKDFLTLTSIYIQHCDLKF